MLCKRPDQCLSSMIQNIKFLKNESQHRTELKPLYIPTNRPGRQLHLENAQKSYFYLA